MTRQRGFTLLELMIVVASLGISVVTLGSAGVMHRRQGLAALQRAEAEVLLEYLAGCRTAGRPPDPAVVHRLEDGLPGAQFRVQKGARIETIEVTFRPASGPPEALSLTVAVR